MNESIDAMFLSFDKMGDALKLGSGFLNDFTSEVDVNLTGLKPEEQQAAVDRALKQTSDNMATAFLDKFRDSIVTRKVTPAHSTNPSGESDGEFVWIDEVVETTTRAQQAAHSSIDAYISDVLRITDVFREGSYGVVDAEGRYSDFVKVIVGMASMFADTNGLSSIFGESIDFKVLEANAKAGESVIDTFNRLNNLFTSTNSVAAGMGKAVESAFGAVGLSSIEMRQKLVDAAGGTEELQKSFAAYSSTYLDSFKQLEPVFQAVADASKSAGVYIGESKDQFVAQVNALDLTTEAGVKMYAELMKIAPMFAQMADSIANATVAFDDVFLTDTEKAAKANQKLADQFAKLGYTGVTTVDQFRKIVDAIDRTTVSGQAMYVALSQLAPAFANMAKSANASLGADRKAEVLARRQAQALTNTPAVEVDQDFLNAQREMEVALLKAQGREEEALNLSRKNSLATMDPQLRAMQQSIWAAEDQADAVQKAADLAEKAMEQLQSNVDKAFDLLTRSVDAQKDTLRTAYDSQVKTIQDNLKVQQDLARTQSKTASESLKSIQSILNSLNDAMKSTEVDSYQLSGVRRRAAQSTLSNALTASNAGASLTNFEGLDEALKTIAKPSEDLFATFVDYSRDQGRTAAIIEGLQINANAQVSVAQLTLDAINGSIDTIQDTAQSQIDALTATYEGEITRLDNILLEAKNSIDALRGIDTSVVSVEAAIVTLTAAIGAAQTAAAEQAAIASQNLQNLLTASSNTTAAASSQTASIQSVNGGMITYDQLNQMQAQAQQRNVMDIANAFMSSDPAVVSAMRDRLGAGSSDAIMNDPNFWSQAMAGGSNDPRIWRMLNAAQNNQSDANTLSGADLQRVMQSRWASLGIASYDVGAPYVDGDQIAMIHNRETVVDANASDVLRRYFGGDAGSGEVAAKIEEVRSEMKAAMIPLVLNVSKMAKILDKFDTEGLPAERTA
jgi:hypothetical protein